MSVVSILYLAGLFGLHCAYNSYHTTTALLAALHTYIYSLYVFRRRIFTATTAYDVNGDIPI